MLENDHAIQIATQPKCTILCSCYSYFEYPKFSIK